MKNVIMISTDQQRADAMGIADSSYRTPHLDELACLGTRYTGIISTSAQCSPSRASWMTGKFPHQVGVYQIGHVLDPAEWGVAKEFNKAGYETVYFGKWHLGLSPAAHEFKITDYHTDGFELQGANPDPRYHSHKDALTTTKALNYLSDYRGDVPFFMKLCWYMPHPNAPVDGPFEYIGTYGDVYPEDSMPVPRSYDLDDLSGKPAFQRERAASAESTLTKDTVRRDALRYRTMLSLMDANLGRIMDMLKEKGMLEHTVILFTSDHGDMQGAHRLRLKGVLPYRELYNVPLILYVPGENAERRVIPDLASSASVPGTLLEAAGIQVPEECEGGSLIPLLKRLAPSPDEHVFFEHYKAYWGHHPLIGVQTAEWKYVHYLEDGVEEMYHLASDPDELVNVAGQCDSDEMSQRLNGLVHDWWARTGGFTRIPVHDPLNPWGREI